MDLTGNPAVPLVLVGNKSDLHAERAVTEVTGKKLAADMKAVFLETSAKDNQCAMDLFMKSIIQIEKVQNHDFSACSTFRHNQADGNSVEEKKNCVIS